MANLARCGVDGCTVHPRGVCPCCGRPVCEQHALPTELCFDCVLAEQSRDLFEVETSRSM